MFIHEKIDLGYADLEATTTEGGRFYATPDTQYPSVTTVLSVFSRDSIAKWRARVGDEEANRVSYRASTRGTAVHEAIEKYIDNQSWESICESYTPDIIDSINSIRGVLDGKLGKVYGQELPLYSDHLRLAGRVDCVAEFDGKISIIDFKTSKRLKKREWVESYFAQEAAYAIMWEERTGMPITQLVTIIAVDDIAGGAPGNQVFVEKRDNWVPKLKEGIELYNREKV